MKNLKTNRCNVNKPYISVVIPTYNRTDYLKICLHSLYKQVINSTRVEIIVVDDSSEFCHYNQNQSLCNLYGFTCIRHRENRGVASARNTGIKNSSGEWIAFLDDDVKVNDFWFSRLLSLLPDLTFNIAGVEGKVESCGHGIWDKEVQNLYGKNYLTCNYCIRKKILSQIGGFDPFFKRSCDDHEITSRILPLGEILFDHKLSVTHLPRKISLKKYIFSSPSRINLLLNSEYIFYRKNPDRYWQFRISRTFWGTFTRTIFRNTINEIRRRNFSSICKHPFQFSTLVLSSIIEQLYSIFLFPDFLKNWLNDGSGLTIKDFNIFKTANLWKTDPSFFKVFKLRYSLLRSLLFYIKKRPIYDLRYTLKRISPCSSLKSTIFFLRIDDLFLQNKELVLDFCKIMKNAGIPYLAAITGDDLKNPQNSFLINEIRHSNGETGLHGFSHSGKFGPFNSEILQLSYEKIEYKINDIPSDNLPSIFIPPFNSIGPQQIIFLSRKFNVICGGPETARFTGRYYGPVALNTNSWYFPSFYPFYSNSRFLLKNNLLKKAITYKSFICITLHFPEEAKDDFENLKKLVNSFPYSPFSWNFFSENKE